MIINKVDNYLYGNITFNEFNRWFNPIAWAIEKQPDEHTMKMVYKLDLVMAEFTSDHRSEISLQSEMEQIIEPYRRLNTLID